MKAKKGFSKKITNLLFIIFLIIIIPILIVSTTILVKSIVKPDEIPSFMGYKPMIVLSGSMENKLFKGDVAVVKVADYNDLKEKDIIAFRTKDNTVITHSIIGITYEDGERVYKTKGDNNNTADNERVTNSNIEGIYQFKIPGFGNFLMWIQKPTGLLISILVIVLIGGCYFFIKNQQELNKLKKENV